MASPLFLFLSFFFFTLATSINGQTKPEIIQACNATRFPETCISSFANSNISINPTPLQIIQSSISISSANLITAQSMVNTFSASAGSNINLTTIIKTCVELLNMSQYRKSSALQSIQSNGTLKNARTWLSAAMVYEYDCFNALNNTKDVNPLNDTKIALETNKTMSFLDSLQSLTSNALSMVRAYDIYGSDIKLWVAPKTERDGFFEKGALGLEFKGGFPSNLTADVTVCKDVAGGCVKTVQEAVNMAPNNGSKRFVIHIKEGVYDEIVRVPIEKKNVVFLGDGIGKTVITGSQKVGVPGMTTYQSATVGVLGDGFMASGVTFQNTAGIPAKQAVAFRSDSDFSYIENCEFLGHQDTLYAHSLRQIYKSCRIVGNVDFIFGNSAAIFQECEILINPRQEDPTEGETNAITAHGRIDPAQSTGFVLQNCSINGTAEYLELYYSDPVIHKTYLGRPWKAYSRVVYIHCNLELLVSAEGWMPWREDFGRVNTLYHAEFENVGPAAYSVWRANWSSKVPAENVHAYSVQNFIQGYDWIPTA